MKLTIERDDEKSKTRYILEFSDIDLIRMEHRLDELKDMNIYLRSESISIKLKGLQLISKVIERGSEK